MEKGNMATENNRENKKEEGINMYLVICKSNNIFANTDVIIECETLDDAIELAREQIDQGRARVRIAKIIPTEISIKVEV